jgi:hypothetical protein
LAIERFYIEGEDGYSEYWRRDKSPSEIPELARVLRSIRRISRYVGRNVGEIVWEGMQIKSGISLNPAFIMGKYPLPAHKTDVAVGMSIHKSYQVTEWSERFKGMILQELTLSPVQEFKFKLFFDMAEKIYVDLLSNRKMLGLYTEKHREWEILERRKYFLAPPSVEELLYIWWERSARRKDSVCGEVVARAAAIEVSEPSVIEKFYKEPLAVLDSIVGRLDKKCTEIPYVSERGAFRISLYRSIWDELLRYISSWPGNSVDPFAFPRDEVDETELEEEHPAITSKISDSSAAIEKEMKRGGGDYTEDIRSIVINKNEVVPIKENDVVMLADKKVDAKLLNDLRMVVQAVSIRNKSYNRGLVTGKIDRRRLYRATTTGTVFLQKKERYEIQNNFVVLIDCSGSMADPDKWARTQTVFQTLFAAIKGFNKKARLIGYNEVNNICKITELFRYGAFYTVYPNGKTASGEAIMATVLSLKGDYKRPFIVHITDGASNWGVSVKEAIAYCEEKKVNLLTLGIACSPSNKMALRNEYGNKVEFIDNIDALPRLFKNLLQFSKRV